MAGFNTHLSGAAISAGLLSSSLLMTDLFSPGQTAVLWLIGTIAGLLPDIDSDSSIAIRGIFNGLGILSSFSVLFLFNGLPLIHLWALMLSAFVLVRFVVMEVFARYTKHRGALHSILAAVMFGSGGAYLGWRFLDLSLDFAWAVGICVFMGYITHLVLDEFSSVNLSGMELKASFGTALKLMSLNNIYTSLLFVAITGFFLVSLPAPERLNSVIFNERASQYVIDSLERLQEGNTSIIDGLQHELKNGLKDDLRN